jgi:Flp pilus assembly protein TadG
MRALPTFRSRRHRDKTRGQSLVEFALILPVFLVFLAAALDLGRVFYANITLNNAAREGAFQAAKTPNLYIEDAACNQATNRVVCRIQNESNGSMVSIQPTDIDMSCSLVGCAPAAGSTVTVDVRGSFQLVTPLLSFVFGGQTLDLSSSAVAQIEYLPDPNTATPPPGPVAVITVNQSSGAAPLTVNFDSAFSTGSPTGYQWDLDANGVVDSTDPAPSHTYTVPGTYNVTLTVVNLTGVNVATKTITVTGPATPTPAGPTPTPTVAPTPACVFPPNTIGQAPSTAQANLAAAGFTNVTLFDDLSSGTKGKIQAQNPDHTQCLAQTTAIVLHYRPN